MEKPNQSGAKKCVYNRRCCNDQMDLDMQECGLSISLQQFKMKVAELTQTRDTPFQDKIPNINWWYWFKQKHLEMNI
jgi:hypothetical protein